MPSISINGIKNYFEISISNEHGFDDLHRIPNAYNLLPIDNEFHTISISYKINELKQQQTAFGIDNVSYYIHSTVSSDIISQLQQQYPLYLSSPWNYNDINATVTNLCIESSSSSNTATPIPYTCDVCEAEIKCGQTLNSDLADPGSYPCIKYYYFNLSQDLPFIIFDSCQSLYNTHLHDGVYDTDLYLYDMNFTVLYQGINEGICTNKEKLSIINLERGQYILGLDYSTDYSECSSSWAIDVICQNESTYPYEARFGSATYWIDAELDCEIQFGTSLATVITEQDMTQAMELINDKFTGLQDLSLLIGLYRDVSSNSSWKWVDGTSCGYTATDDCIDDMHWGDNQPSIILNQGQLPERVPFVAGYLFIPMVGNATNTTSYMYDAYDFWRGNTGWLCNAPIDGNYVTTNCSEISKCWHNMECCNDSILTENTQYKYFDFKPVIAYWDSKMYVIGAYGIHYANINLSAYQYAWKHKSFELFNHTQYVERVIFTQYRSSLYLFDSNSYRLIRINLDTIHIESYAVPVTGEPSDGDCMVATGHKVYVIRESIMFTFDVHTTEWITTHLDVYITIMPYTCAITNNHDSIYIFGLLIYAGWVDGVIKYDTITQEFTYLDIACLCSVNSANAVTARNGKIYLHGCYAASWKTVIFDPIAEQFELETVDIDYPAKTSHYRTGRMLVFDDNVLLLLVPHVLFGSAEQLIDSNSYGMTLYSSITDLISINFTDTISSEYIWPSDGFAIQYYLNDFANGINQQNDAGIYHIWFYCDNGAAGTTINASVILNTANDSCVCNGYNCHDCYQYFCLTDYLSPNDSNINLLQFEPINYYDFDVLFLPKQITVKLQRCNISLSTKTQTTDNNKKSVDIDYSLSDNCYTRIGTNFSFNVTAETMNISNTLIISIAENKTVECKVCELVNILNDCFVCEKNKFTIHHSSNKYGAFSILFTSNMVDVHINSFINSIQFVESYSNRQANGKLLYLLFLLAVIFIVLLFVYIYWKKQYSHAFIVDNALVLLIGISQFDNKEAHLPGVKACIDTLIDLWRNSYNYDVFVCNESSLYAKKKAIIKFVDTSIKRMRNCAYNCVIVHVISHGSKGVFYGSDLRYPIDLSFIAHELESKAAESKNIQLLKLIFHHGCQGNADYSFSPTKKTIRNGLLNMYQSKGNLKYNTENMSYESNFGIIAGNIEGRAMSDSGRFTQCIFDSFKANLNRMIKWSLDALIKEIRRNLESVTNHSELVTVEENICYDTIRFEKAHSMLYNPVEIVQMTNVAEFEDTQDTSDSEIP